MSRLIHFNRQSGYPADWLICHMNQSEEQCESEGSRTKCGPAVRTCYLLLVTCYLLPATCHLLPCSLLRKRQPTLKPSKTIRRRIQHIYSKLTVI